MKSSESIVFSQENILNKLIELTTFI